MAVAAVAGVVAVIDGMASSRAFALGAVAGMLGIAGLAVNVRQIAGRTVRVVTVAIAKAPREAYFRGYGDASADALNPPANNDDTTELMRI